MAFATIDKLSPTLIPQNIDLDRCIDVGSDVLTPSEGTYASPGYKLAGAASNNTSLTHALRLPLISLERWCDPNNINTGEDTSLADFTIRVRARLTGTPATSAQLSLTCKESSKEGGVTGAELNGTGAQNMLAAGAGNWADYDFAIEGGSQVRGDALIAYLQATNNDSGGTGGGQIEIASIEIREYQR